MQSVEYRPKLKKKGTTSAQGCEALDGITAIIANENKENEVTDPSTVNKRKEPGEPAVVIAPNKKKEYKTKAKGAKKAPGTQKT
jgi:hypothetical protein